MENNHLREKLVEELSSYYSKVGVNPYDFHCPHCPNNCPGDLARGMECHIGLKYGLKKKILVSSMDSGGGGSENIKGRTESVYKDHSNPHMRGTLDCVKLLLDLGSREEAIDYMAMTNACKCCKKESTNHLPKKYYEHCKEYKIAEYHFLNPDVIIFQGERDLSLRGVEQYLKPTSLEHLYIYEDGIIKCYGIECIHPSARGKHAKRVKEFYERLFPRIVDYIKEQWEKESL